MKLQNKCILLISPEPWKHIFVSKHHYATHLAALGNKVYFLNPPSDKLKIDKTEFNSVYTINYTGFIKGLRFLPYFLQRYFIKRKFEKLQVLSEVNFDIIWSFDNSVFFDFSTLPQSIYKISHIVDLNQNFQFAKAAMTADLCLGVIPTIIDRFKKYNKNSFLITHGVQEFSDNIKHVVLPGNSSVKALYVGNLAMPYIDWSLFKVLIQQNRNVDFIFIGSNIEIGKSRLDRKEANLFFFGGC